jgi:membrane protein
MPPGIERILKRKERIRKRTWKTLPVTTPKAERFFYLALRVATITLVGIKENRLLNRAAALSFSSLIGLIPMIAIIILLSGFALEKTDPDLVVNNIHKGISYIAPQLSGLDGLSDEPSSEGEEGREQLKAYLQEFVKASQSGAVGISGIIALILIVMQLFSSI